MRLLGPTKHPRLNEALAVVFLFAGIFLLLGFASYHPFDPSLNTTSSVIKAANLTGKVGAYLADFWLQGIGLSAYAIPFLILTLGWQWLGSRPITSSLAKLCGAALLLSSTSVAFGFFSAWHPIGGVLPAGGFLGLMVAAELVAAMNLTGAVMFTAVCWILALYLVSKFEMSLIERALARPIAAFRAVAERIRLWRDKRSEIARERAEIRAQKRAQVRLAEEFAHRQSVEPARGLAEGAASAAVYGEIPIVDPVAPPFTPNKVTKSTYGKVTIEEEEIDEEPVVEDIPIRMLEPVDSDAKLPVAGRGAGKPQVESRKGRTFYKLPSTKLLTEPPERTVFDSQELKETAVAIKSKFEEFNVRGAVTQINPGPVVTTFEFKPEAGVKYSRITTLSEDLCLGLQAESILIERIPGKPTVGIEVPNSKREVISLRQILESDEFHSSASPLTVALGKDINGRIKVAALDTMPHLLIAGSTGAGKSVMLNSLIMSILYKATPDQVRLIMVDPKRLEFGLYEGIPHLLTPVITDAKKATNALRNAVLEMERRLKLLASLGVRNIDQYNRKVRQLQSQPRSLFEEPETEEPELSEIPYVLILIDELADLMMLERANVEESVTRLAQMARAVGMHLVLATQRPSVDVITGLIKANFPSRISFRVATRVDSRTVLDVMGAEHLLGKGDMLFLPPGSSRLVRVHGSYVSESETNDVVEYWKKQAEPDYDQTFLLAPPSDDDEMGGEDFDAPEDAMYQEAVRVVLEQGKASTSTLQRRLRLGYGRAARILDMMQREGIIGPPDGSRPREVLKRPDWFEEVENQLR
ncbi:MAG: DNA translocase FtsK 4TM domain-containing protein [Bryobacteraceae bacterium]